MINSEMTFDYSEVIQKLSEPLRKKLEHSVELLRKAERLALAYDEENGYYLAFSGGKARTANACIMWRSWQE